MGVTLKNDPQKARGKRGALVLWEEAGKFNDFLTAWKIAQPSVEESGFAFGFMMAGGTGGVEGGAFEGLEEIFYNSEVITYTLFLMFLTKIQMEKANAHSSLELILITEVRWIRMVIAMLLEH